MNLPTKTAEMREAIILTLARLKFKYPEDNGFMSTTIQNEMVIMYDPGHDWYFTEGAFDDRSGPGKAYDRAEQQLRDEGVIVMHPNDPNGIERTLKVFLDLEAEPKVKRTEEWRVRDDFAKRLGDRWAADPGDPCYDIMEEVREYNERRGADDV